MTPPPVPNAELTVLREEVTHSRRVDRELLGTVADLRDTVERQQAHIDRLVRMTFGRRPERVTGPTLFDDARDPEPVAPVDVPSVDPNPTEGSTTFRRRGHGRRPRPVGRPRERVEVDLTEAEKACPCCRRPRVRIGSDVSERLDYRPACRFIRQTVRATYACRSCERAGDGPRVTRPPLPPEPIPRGTAAAGRLAHVLVSKYCDHLPLYRLEGILGRLGRPVHRSTLCDQVMASAEVLEPLYRLMCDRVQGGGLHADDTPVPLLAPRRTAHAWVYVGDAEHAYTAFDLTAGRSQEFPAAFLAGYTDFPQADGYPGYNPIITGGATRVGRRAHARRYFFDARLSDPERAHDALARIRGLYAVEREAKEKRLTESDLTAFGQARAGPVLAAVADWLAEHRPRVLPKSAVGEALTYATNQ
jgi:transposase